MKLATFVPKSTDRSRVGALLTVNNEDYFIDVRRAYADVLRRQEHDPFAEEAAAVRIPLDMLSLLAGGDASMAAVRRGVNVLRDRVETTSAPQALVDAGLLHRRSEVQLLAPIPRPGKVVAIGANYQAHVQEGRDSGALGQLPSYPPAFLKMSSAVIGTEQPIHYPTYGSELDYEVEFSIVIGKRCRDIAERDWLDVVAGYTIVNDLTMRDVILEEAKTGVVFSGKNFDNACPMGPYLVTKDELPNPDDLALRLRVNGETRQSDRTSSMTYSCSKVVSYWSRLGLEPGDVLTTGTPGGGAGFGRKFPERLLKRGDIIEAEVEGIGILRNQVI